MTGDSTRLEIRDEYFDSYEEGLVSDQSNADVVITENQPPEDNNKSAGCSNVAMSPKAVKAAKDHIITTDSEIQCSLIDTVGNNFGNERFCRVCGRDYEADTRQEQKLWIGCTQDDCDYWLHVKCLLGKSKKITPKFCQCMPYLCPFHRD
ncbi:uncharacterized protein LOC123547269 [Mercenaria mercenaria]|uniref:uncharacterized protein LOC123547269 n=1 Tax=Mercenaria mercenaria TaxID=6596 RepID=UPI001E1D524E|nr:uncharacterized protein LOC123547269 [Mercenaria mercenaria]